MKILKTKLKKELNLLDLTMLGLGGIIGSGWLFASQKAANLAGPAAVISWIIGGLCVFFIALVYAELAGMLPESGSLIRYPQYTHGNFVSYALAIALIIGDSSVIAIEALATVQFSSTYLPFMYNNHQVTLIGWLSTMGLIVIYFLLNYWSIRIAGKTNTVITILKFITPVLTVLFLIASFNPANLTQHGGFAPFGFPAILAAVSSGGIIFAYLGFRQAVNMAGEAKNPTKDVPLAVGLAVVIGIVLYASLQLVFVGSLPAQEIAKGWGHLNFRSPFADILLLMNVQWLATIVFADAVLSPSGTGLIYVTSTSRIINAQALNGIFWKVFMKVDEKTGIPRYAMWLTLILAFLWTAPFPSWNKLVGIVSNAIVLTYMIGPVSVVSLRKFAPNLYRPFKAEPIMFISIIAFIVCTLLIDWSGWSNVSVLIAVDLVAFLLYFYFVFTRDELKKDLGKNIKSGYWLICYLLFVALMSYIGSKHFEGLGMIKYPYDQYILIVVSIAFFFWAVNSAHYTDDIKEIVDERGDEVAQRASK
ncbi:MAG: APC family permease [Thermodesulfobium sp.]